MALIEESINASGDKTSDFSPLAYEADNFGVAKEDKSIFDSGKDFLTMGVPIAVHSALLSFYNTGVESANWFGRKSGLFEGNFEEASMERDLQEADESGNLLAYYKQHEQGLEAGGLILGSFAPGMAAVKALKLMQEARLAGALGKATNLLPGKIQTSVISRSLDEINAGNASLYGAIGRDKLKAIALGYGDQALQAAAWELATVATMKANPTISKDDLGDIVSHTLSAALVGGLIGGSIEGIMVSKQFKNALLSKEAEEKMFELSTRLGVGNYLSGDRAVKLLESLDKIPEAKSISAKTKAAQTIQSGVLETEKILKDIVPEGDGIIARQFVATLRSMKNDMKLPNEYLYDMLSRLSRIQRVGDYSSELSPEIFYINKFSKAENPELNELITSSPQEKAEAAFAYKYKPTADGRKPIISRFAAIADDVVAPNTFLSQKDAFASGSDIYIGKDLSVSVNPESEILTRSARPGEGRKLSDAEEKVYRTTGSLPTDSSPLLGASVYFNLLDGSVTNRAFAVAGDLHSDIGLTNAGLRIGPKYVSKQEVNGGYKAKELSTINASSRYLWASERGVQAGDKIEYLDLPMLDAVTKDYAKARAKEVKYIDNAGNLRELPEDSSLFATEVKRQRGRLINSLLEDSAVASKEVEIKAGVRSLSAEPMVKDLEEFRKANTVRLSYDISSAVHDPDGMIARGSLDVQYRINLAKQQASATAANFFKDKYEQMIVKLDAGEADSRGAGPGFFTSANADYGSAAQKAEFTGAQVNQHILNLNNNLSDTIAGVHSQISLKPQLGAELATLTNVLRKTGERYIFVPSELAAAKGIDGELLAVEKSFKYDKSGQIVDWNPDFLPEGAGWVNGKQLAAGETKGQANFYKLSPEVASYGRIHIQLNDDRLIHHNNWLTAQGINHKINLGAWYAPPIDTRKYPFVALVRELKGAGSAGSSVGSIVAEDAAALEQKVAGLQDKYEIFFKGTTKKYHEVLGDYDYNMNLVQNTVDSALKREGRLSDVLPDLRGDTNLNEYLDWHQRQNTRLVRNMVELANGQLFAELRSIGERYTLAETSKFGKTLAYFTRSAENPFNSYIKTALGISPKTEYSLWQEANEKSEAFFSTAFRAAKETFGAASKGIISFEEATKLTKAFGLGNPYGEALEGMKNYGIATRLPPERYLSKFVSLANSALSATVIRLDQFQTLINAVSTPILLASETNAAIRKLTQVELPDTSGRFVPAPTRPIFRATQDYFGQPGKDLLAKYQEWNVGVRKLTSDYHELMDNVTLVGNETLDAVQGKMKKIVDLGAKLTLADRTEEFVRFVAARTADIIFSEAGFIGTDLQAQVRTFVNRVHGNYVSSQRPVAFQGPLGQAMGLFQTYQFNLMQQVFRHVENGDKKSLAILFGLQSSLFGLQGLPGFQAINTHIVGNASNNPDHTDFYSAFPSTFDKKLGDYLLYGTVSNWLGTGLYTRGDIQPRQITILPVNPLDYPAVSGSIKFLSNLFNVAEKTKDGGNLLNTITQGLEHNGISRPLTGIAQTVQGYTTTSSGSLISASNDWFSLTSAARMAGSRPLDEALTMDALYRKTAYQAKDNVRMQHLGEAVKTTLLGGASPDAQQIERFATEYAASGGRVENFGRKMLEWSKDANISVANKIYMNLKNPLNVNMMKVMGGKELPDYSFGGTGAAESVPASILGAARG